MAEYSNQLLELLETEGAHEVLALFEKEGSKDAPEVPKPFFKFYKNGEMIDEVKFMSSWSEHEIKVREVMAKHNGPSGSYSWEGKIY